jgi:hypothetical protein
MSRLVRVMSRLVRLMSRLVRLRRARDGVFWFGLASRVYKRG